MIFVNGVIPKDLEKNKTLGLGGNFTIQNVKYDSEIKDITKLQINIPPTANVIQPDVVRKAVDSNEIDWYETFILREKREPINGEEVFINDIINAWAKAEQLY